ncbi:hypothetical protein HMPREF0239_04875 [Clostridium sp. ATCC BAA-442]|nr:hypothetical protein HMPREF0239_04875 [Clostridium sp. ATCC BAA-442]
MDRVWKPVGGILARFPSEVKKKRRDSPPPSSAEKAAPERTRSGAVFYSVIP